MCDNREHRFRLTITNLETGKEHSLCTYAKGLAGAVARADAWAHANILSLKLDVFNESEPASAAVEIKVHRTGYSTRESAAIHGADFIFVDQRDAELARWEANTESELLSKYS